MDSQRERRGALPPRSRDGDRPPRGWGPSGPPPPPLHIHPQHAGYGVMQPIHGQPPYLAPVVGGYGGLHPQSLHQFRPPYQHGHFPPADHQQHVPPPPLPAEPSSVARPPSQAEDGELVKAGAATAPPSATPPLEVAQQAAAELEKKRRLSQEAAARQGDAAQTGSQAEEVVASVMSAKPNGLSAAAAASQEQQRPGSGDGGSHAAQASAAPRAAVKVLGIKANRSLAGNIQMRPRSAAGTRGKKELPDIAAEVAAEVAKVSKELGVSSKGQQDSMNAEASQPAVAAKEAQGAAAVKQPQPAAAAKQSQPESAAQPAQAQGQTGSSASSAALDAAQPQMQVPAQPPQRALVAAQPAAVVQPVAVAAATVQPVAATAAAPVPPPPRVRPAAESRVNAAVPAVANPTLAAPHLAAAAVSAAAPAAALPVPQNAATNLSLPPGFLVPAAAPLVASKAASVTIAPHGQQQQQQLPHPQQQAAAGAQLAAAGAAAKAAPAAAEKQAAAHDGSGRRGRSHGHSSSRSEGELSSRSSSRSSSWSSRSSRSSSRSRSRSRSRGRGRRGYDRHRRTRSRSRDARRNERRDELRDGRRDGRREGRREDAARLRDRGPSDWRDGRLLRPVDRLGRLPAGPRHYAEQERGVPWREGRLDELHVPPGDRTRLSRGRDTRDSRAPPPTVGRERDMQPRPLRRGEREERQQTRDFHRGSPAARRTASPILRRRGSSPVPPAGSGPTSGAGAVGQRRGRSRSRELLEQLPEAKRRWRGDAARSPPPLPPAAASQGAADSQPAAASGQPPGLPRQLHELDQRRSPDISADLCRLASVYGVALETASELELCVLPEAMKVWANSKEPEGFLEWQRDQLDALARQLSLPAPALHGTAKIPFSEEEWSRQIPDAELIVDNGTAQNLPRPPRRMPLEPVSVEAAAAAGGAAAGDEAAPAVPAPGPSEGEPATAAVDGLAEPVRGQRAGLASAQGQQQPADEEGPQASKSTAEASAPAVLSSAAADPRRQPAAAAEYAAAAAWYQRGDLPLPDFAQPVAAPAESGLSWSQDPPLTGQQEQEATSAAAAAAAAAGDDRAAPGDGGELYAPAAPRHDDTFHRSLGATRLASGSCAERPAEIEEGYWSALLPDLRGKTSPRQLDLLQEQARAGQLEAGWPIYRESDRLHCYLTDNPPALADLAWPNPKPSNTPERFVVACAQPLASAAGAPAAAEHAAGAAVEAAVGGGGQRTEQEVLQAGAAADGERQAQQAQSTAGLEAVAPSEQQPGLTHDQQVAAEEAALRALQQRAQAAGVGMSNHASLDMLPSQHPQAIAAASAAAQASGDSEAGLAGWLRLASQPGSAAGRASQQLAAQQHELRCLRRPLQRLHGPPPPANVGAAVRQLLLKRHTADLVLKKVLAEVACKLAEERAQQRERVREQRRRSDSSLGDRSWGHRHSR